MNGKPSRLSSYKKSSYLYELSMEVLCRAYLYVRGVGHIWDLEHLPDGTIQVDNVKLVERFGGRKHTVGTLYVTATYVIFVDPNGRKETWILMTHIASVEKLPLTTNGSPLQIRCKTFQNVTFEIPRERDCNDIYTSLLRLSQPTNLEDLYSFQYTCPELQSNRSLGWDFVDLKSEYLRMGVPNSNWILSDINLTYDLCDTYPRLLYVPATASKHILMGSAKFRSKSRLPVLSYLHRDNQAAICRCSQPLAGFSARCLEDETMLQSIQKANPASNYMYVVDTRPMINAMANRAQGKGYENENFYSNIKFQFVGIENIHVMRSSLQKMLEVCELKNPSMSAFLSGLDSSGWLKNLKAILDTALFIAKAISDGINVVVHCSDGWDRTAQTCSLASLLLDPYYRTIDGFQTLIEKEWLSFGFKFIDRCGYLGGCDPKERSPIFTQFIDCVWQLTQHYPRAFQFNERYLVTLHDHVYACQFGTFIGNCEKDRVDLRLCERTYSLWGYLFKLRSDFLNPFYEKDFELIEAVLMMDTSPQSIRFWRNLYCFYDSSVHPRENVTSTICAIKEHTSSLEDHKKLLEKRVASLCKFLGKGEDQLSQALQSFSSSESMDFRAVLLAVDGHRVGPKEPSSTAPATKRTAAVRHPSQSNGDGPAIGALPSSIDEEVTSNTSQRLSVQRGVVESDSESGFEEDGTSSLQMSKSVRSEGPASDCCSGESLLDGLQVNQLLAELQSVAVDWATFRSTPNCSCTMPFEQQTKRNHCLCCGNVFCTRCIVDRQMSLRGHLSQRPVPVCKACYKDLKQSPTPSVDDFKRLQRQLSTQSNHSLTKSSQYS